MAQTYYCCMDYHEEGDGRFIESDGYRRAAEKYVEQFNHYAAEYPDERVVLVRAGGEPPQKFVVYTHHVPEYEARPVKATRKDA